MWEGVNNVIILFVLVGLPWHWKPCLPKPLKQENAKWVHYCLFLNTLYVTWFAWGNNSIVSSGDLLPSYLFLTFIQLIPWPSGVGWRFTNCRSWVRILWREITLCRCFLLGDHAIAWKSRQFIGSARKNSVPPTRRHHLAVSWKCTILRGRFKSALLRMSSSVMSCRISVRIGSISIVISRISIVSGQSLVHYDISCAVWWFLAD